MPHLSPSECLLIILETLGQQPNEADKERTHGWHKKMRCLRIGAHDFWLGHDEKFQHTLQQICTLKHEVTRTNMTHFEISNPLFSL